MTKKTENSNRLTKWTAKVALANGILLLVGTTLNLVGQIGPRSERSGSMVGRTTEIGILMAINSQNYGILAH